MRDALCIADQYKRFVLNALTPCAEAEPFGFDKLIAFYCRCGFKSPFLDLDRFVKNHAKVLEANGYELRDGVVHGALSATLELFSEIVDGRPIPPPGAAREELRRRYRREAA